MLHWLNRMLPVRTAAITPASADASFRRYYRIRRQQASYIVMDAPPDKEDCKRFIVVAHALFELGVQAPRVLEADLDLGFLLLTDLGTCQYLNVLNDACVERLYGDALKTLTLLQLGGDPSTPLLPRYTPKLLQQELGLFRQWFLAHHLSLPLKAADHEILDNAFTLLCTSALEQPQVWVHRDYHSRNLMVTEFANPGVLDFQDAVIGPVTYDLVSLLRDCYIAWPRQRVEGWALRQRARLQAEGLAGVEDADAFLRWFDLMGIQRHLKAIGIFARLHHRDGKPGYLGDIPRTLGYVLDVAGRYPELALLHDLLSTRIAPALTGP
jgi:aminoglycoside/choline kinase family phosphotransferase